MKKNNKGFTLAELLIVVAIIAVLVAVAIPVFSTQLEKAREATDVANIRSAYAEAVANAMTNPGGSGESSTYKVQQKTAGWANTDIYASLPTELKAKVAAESGDGAWAKRNSGDYKVTVTTAEDGGSLTVNIVAGS